MHLYNNIIFPILIFLGAVLYSSVGHGGASAYIAIMALYGIAPSEIKPVALLLNIFVSSISAWKYYRAGWFSSSIFFPVCLASVPFAFLGGLIIAPPQIYKVVLGVILLFAALRLVVQKDNYKPIRKLPFSPVVLSGAVIGLLSGITGVGGGIFLSPLLIFMGWANTRTASGVSAAFIFANSVAGILGFFYANSIVLPAYFWLITPMAILGGLLGSYLGSIKVPTRTILLMLAFSAFDSWDKVDFCLILRL